jgi:hypothetical protein
MTVGFVLALFISSATARVGTVIPIMVGITMPLRLPAASSLAATLMTCPQACSIFNMAVKTGAPQNLISLSFIEGTCGRMSSSPGSLAMRPADELTRLAAGRSGCHCRFQAEGKGGAGRLWHRPCHPGGTATASNAVAYVPSTKRLPLRFP